MNVEPLPAVEKCVQLVNRTRTVKHRAIILIAGYALSGSQPSISYDYQRPSSPSKQSPSIRFHRSLSNRSSSVDAIFNCMINMTDHLKYDGRCTRHSASKATDTVNFLNVRCPSRPVNSSLLLWYNIIGFARKFKTSTYRSERMTTSTPCIKPH